MDDAVSRAREAVRMVVAKGQAAKAASSLQQQPSPIPVEPEPVLMEVTPPKAGGSYSKKGDMAKLPRTWRDRVFKASKPENKKISRLTSAVALLWATGCRPVEIEKGIKVQLVDGQLKVNIQGAKHGTIDNGDGVFERGMEWRTLTLDPKFNAATEYLARIAQDGKEHVLDYNKNSLRTRLNELGRVALSNLKNAPSVSPYTFRHAMGSDVKSCDAMTDAQKSQIMGHLSADSLQSYGRRRHGGGGVSPVVQVEASAEPHGEYSSYAKKETKKAKPR